VIERVSCISACLLGIFFLVSCGNRATSTVSGTVSGEPAGSAVLVIAANQAENLYDTDNVTTRAEGILDKDGTLSFSITEVIVDMKYLTALVDVVGDGEYTEPEGSIGAAGVLFTN
jgi:hypothetical protein